MKKWKVAIIGSTGFIGSSLANYLIKTGELPYYSLTFISRNSGSKKLSINKSIRNTQADHLDFHNLKAAINDAEIIFDLAGLAWQNPELEINRQELLIEQVMQNAISAAIISLVVRKEQKLVWISSNGVDIFLSRIMRDQKKLFDRQVDKFIDLILEKTKPEKTELLQTRLVVLRALNGFITWNEDLLLKFSYAFSKYLGQKILSKMLSGNVKILKLSDVYGPGQDISERVLVQTVPARRIQRFVAAHKLISEGKTDWIPDMGKKHLGFYKNKGGKIIQEIWADTVSPTYIEDVCRILLKAATLENSKKIILDASGKNMSNKEIVWTIRDLFATKVEIKEVGNPSAAPENPQSYNSLVMSNAFISFEEGLLKWRGIM